MCQFDKQCIKFMRKFYNMEQEIEKSVHELLSKYKSKKHFQRSYE